MSSLLSDILLKGLAGRSSPSLNFNFVDGSAFSPQITFTRASTATYFDATGTLQSAAIDVPRFDYDPATLAARGFLIEEQRTNLIFPSEDFANATYTPTNITGVVNAAVAPNGTTTADELVEDSALGVHGFLGPVVNVANATVYTCSIFAKVKAGTKSLFIYGQNSAAYLGVNAGAKFNVSGAVISTGATYGTSTSSVQSVGNGWYRCVVTFPATVASAAAQNLRIVLDNGTGTPTGGAASYAGDGTSGFFVWGAQLEAGSFATSYIPTTTTALTRSADVASVNTLSPWYNATEGTLYAEFFNASDVLAQRFAAINDGTSNNSIEIISSGTGTGPYGFVQSGGSGQTPGPSPSSSITANTLYKTAIAYATNNAAGFLNGVQNVIDTTSVVVPTGLTKLQIGSQTSSINWSNAWIQRVTYYPRRLSQAEGQALTA